MLSDHESKSEQADRLNRLVTDLLDVARLDGRLGELGRLSVRMKTRQRVFGMRQRLFKMGCDKSQQG